MGLAAANRGGIDCSTPPCTASCSSTPLPPPPQPTLSTFGLLITGRLELRNELLSALSAGNTVWEDRYCVLTRKGLHYYVRAKKGNLEVKDIFGKHEGSVAIKDIAHIEVDGPRPLEITLVTRGPGRNYTFRARTEEAVARWKSTLQTAVQSQGASLFSSMVNLRASASFPNVPSLLDFGVPPPVVSDNLSHLSLASHSLSLSLLLETGLPWGVGTTIDSCKHRLSLSKDVLSAHLEGGGVASIPLAQTVRRAPAGSLVVPVQPACVHSHIRMSWSVVTRPASSGAAGGGLTRSPKPAITLVYGVGIFGFIAAAAFSGGLFQGVCWLVCSAMLRFLLGAVRSFRGTSAADGRAWSICFSAVPASEVSEGSHGFGVRGPGSGSSEGSYGSPSSVHFNEAIFEAGGEGRPRCDTDGDMKMDALLAHICSSEHSVLYDATVALREALPPPGSRELPFQKLLDALDAGVLGVLGALGPSLLLVVKNDQSNLRKARHAAAAAAAAGMRCATVREVFDSEIAAGLHTLSAPADHPANGSLADSNGNKSHEASSAVLSDPSAAMSILWMSRSLDLTISLMDELMQEEDALGTPLSCSSAAALQRAYASVLEPYHGWLIRKTFSVVSSQAPGYEAMTRLLSPGVGDAERQSVVQSEMRAFIDAGRPVIKLLRELFAEMRLEDTRRV